MENTEKYYKDIISKAISEGASDIHIANNSPPVFRINGVLTTFEEFCIFDKKKLREFTKIVISEENLEKYEKEKSIDTSFHHETSRFRVHVFKEMGCDTVAMRLIPTEIPRITDLNLPLSIRKFSELKNGLVLVVGATGSGKSTTLATIINEINENHKKRIITVEDPVEFIHKHKQSLISQREVGSDVSDFSQAVKGAMREDPDVILVGELRDLDTIKNAITMAETGHLVFGTLHTRSVAETVDRLIDVFPPNQQEQIRIQLSNSIQGIISQELLPATKGGRVALCEVMFVTPAIKNLIREHGNPNSIVDQMLATSRKNGSQTKIQGLAKLVINNDITKEAAVMSLTKEEEIEELNRMIVNS